jgi:hypothetical protein
VVCFQAKATLFATGGRSRVLGNDASRRFCRPPTYATSEIRPPRMDRTDEWQESDKSWNHLVAVSCPISGTTNLMKVLARLSVGANYGSQTHVRAERKQADKKRATEDLFISALAQDLPHIHPS